MLKAFSVKNYKNFKNTISINFGDVAGYQFNTDCISNSVIAKMLIYGLNATGKTNLGKGIMDIKHTIFPNSTLMQDGVFINADSTEDVATFSYKFCFDNVELVYKYTRISNKELRDEELFIDGTIIYKCDFANRIYNFDNLKHIDAEIANTDIYLQAFDEVDKTEQIIESKLPFIRWLIGNVALKSDSIIIKLANYVRKMRMVKVDNRINYIFIKNSFYEFLDEKERLKDLERFLNVMGIECNLVLKNLPDGQRELYFAHEKLVPFYENASSGTLALVNLYSILVPKMWEYSFIYLDEFDAFYHYEMAENVINFFKKRYPDCQLIMTTHNTNLMTNRIMRPDCVFILSRKGKLTPLCNATMRELREGHNLEKMYISGEFEKYE